MVGIDIVRNDRIESALKRFGERFLRRVYTDKEIEYCNSHKSTVPCLSARWACKEAVLKAFYIEFGVLLKFKEIEVLGRTGYPARVVLHNPNALEKLGGREIIVSISHERDHSVAVALIK